MQCVPYILRLQGHTENFVTLWPLSENCWYDEYDGCTNKILRMVVSFCSHQEKKWQDRLYCHTTQHLKHY